MTLEISRRLIGGKWRTATGDDGGGNGGSSSYGVAVRDFIETAGAGTYTATVVLPAGARVTGIYGLNITGPWDADSAPVVAGDTPNPTGYINGSVGDATDLSGSGGGGQPYDPTAPDNDVNYVDTGTTGGAYAPGMANGLAAVENRPGVLYIAGDTLTITVVTLGAGGTSGHCRFYVEGYLVPDGQADAVKS